MEQRLQDTLILMNNRMGIRIEFNIDKQQLELWISPKAATSLDYYDRNFSNRDDHTNLFDKITFPNLKIADFLRCNYDPFYSSVYFKNQTLHIHSLPDQPCIVLWFDQNEQVDFKSDKADVEVSRENNVFCIKHPDRRYVFEFAAVLGEGPGRFSHQLSIDEGRSIYARAQMEKKQVLVITGGIEGENILANAKQISAADCRELLQQTASKAEEACSTGRVLLKDDEELQRLIELNKKIFWSVQDTSGALFAAIKKIYYMIWVRDGGLACSWNAYTGWADSLKRWTEFQMANPTEITGEQPAGRTFLQLVNKKITKWEEDGVFFAVWSAFTFWTQTGSEKFLGEKYLSIMDEAVQWLENYCFDQEKGLFGRYFYCETPFEGCRDDGWDYAVGKPASKSKAIYEGKEIVRSYDSYINLLMYSTYMMLSSMHDGVKASEYLDKAQKVESHMKYMFAAAELPAYGPLLTKEGDIIEAGPYGLDDNDYLWGMSIAPFAHQLLKMQAIREKMLDKMLEDKGRYFIAGYCSVVASLDTAFMDEDKVMKAIQNAAVQCYRPGKYLPMPYTMIEMLNVEDGNEYHDIRPQSFTIGAFLAAVSNLAVHRLPFGISLRATKYISKIQRYEYLGGELEIEYDGCGKISSILLNGTLLQNTYQIPDNMLTGKDTIHITLDHATADEPVLVASTVKLKKVSKDAESICYNVEAYGKNELVFNNLKNTVKVTNPEGNAINTPITSNNDMATITFSGRGMHIIEIAL